MNAPLTLPTEQDPVVLRQLTVEDAPAYFAAVDANRDHLSQFGDETAAKYPDLKSVVNSIANPSNPDKIRMGIWDGDTFVGSANLTPDEDGQATELGYWLDARHTGKGYATLATTALSKYALPRFHRVYAEVVEGNEASSRVLMRSGFEQTAREAGRLIFEATSLEQAEPANLHEVAALQDVQVREGVSLRPMDASDATRMLEILEADTTIRDRVSVASKMHTPEDVEAQVESYQQDEHLIRYAILEGDNPIGLVSFWRDVDNPFDAPDNPDDYGFGYFLDPAKRGSGIVADAVKTIMDVAAQNIHINQFIAYCEDNNPDSIAVLTKLGFQPTDTVLVEQNSGWTERKYVRKPE